MLNKPNKRKLREGAMTVGQLSEKMNQMDMEQPFVSYEDDYYLDTAENLADETYINVTYAGNYGGTVRKIRMEGNQFILDGSFDPDDFSPTPTPEDLLVMLETAPQDAEIIYYVPSMGSYSLVSADRKIGDWGDGDGTFDMVALTFSEEPVGELNESRRVDFSAEVNSIEDSLNKMLQGSESVHLGFNKVEIRGPGAPIVYSAVLNEDNLLGSTVEGVKDSLDEYEANIANRMHHNQKEFAMYESANIRAHIIVENEEGFKYLIDQIGGDFSGVNPDYYGDKIPNAFARALTFEDWQFMTIDDGSFCEEDLLLSKEEFDTIFDSATKMYIQLQVQFEERRSEYSYEMYESKKKVQEAVPAGFLNELREVANALKMFVEDYTGNDYSDYLSRLLRGDITMGEFLDHMDEAVAFGDFGADYVDFDDGAMPAEAEEEYIDLRYDYCKVAELEF